MKHYPLSVINEALRRGNIDAEVEQAFKSHMPVEDALKKGLITESTIQMLDDIQYEINH